jgi:hypothetical protein
MARNRSRIAAPDGSRLIVQEENLLPTVEFMTEDEQCDAPDAIQQWIDDLRAIPPAPTNAAKNADWQAW